VTKLRARVQAVEFPARAITCIFLFATASRPVLGPTQLPIQCVPGVLTSGVKQPEREDDH